MCRSAQAFCAGTGPGSLFFARDFEDDLPIQSGIFFRRIKARAGFIGIITVPVNSASIHRNQVREQLQQALLLLWRPVVLGLTVCVYSANVGNANAVSVVSVAVSSRL